MTGVKNPAEIAQRKLNVFVLGGFFLYQVAFDLVVEGVAAIVSQCCVVWVGPLKRASAQMGFQRKEGAMV